MSEKQFLRHGLNGNQLKLIAVISMLCDHAAIRLLVYVFLLTEGFCHTRNRRRYALRLGVFALISEIPFDLLVYGKIWDTHSQNVFFTLFLGVLMLTAVDWIGRNTDAALAQYRQMAVVVGAALLAWFLRTDYDAAGIMLIAAAEFQPIYIPGLAVSFFLIRCYNGTRGSWKGKWFFYLVYPVHLLVLYGISRLVFG